jgi:hypothetical protein
MEGVEMNEIALGIGWTVMAVTGVAACFLFAAYAMDYIWQIMQRMYGLKNLMVAYREWQDKQEVAK